MSRRFGRNQRRRAREELAESVRQFEQATEKGDRNLRMYQNSERNSAELRSFFDEVANRVGRESVLVGGEVGLAIEGDWVRDFRYTPPQSDSSDFSDFFENSTPYGRSVVKYEIMRRLEIGAVRDIFKRQTVVRCYLGEAAAGIALSDEFLKRSTEKEIENRIARELARTLVRTIKGAKPL